MTTWLVYTLAILQGGVAIGALRHREWSLATVWVCYAIATIALGDGRR